MTSDLPTTRPDGPGFYREDLEGRPVVWLSWWNPPRPFHQDRLRVSIPQEGEGFPWSAAVQGVRLLGAQEAQNEGYRAMLAFRFLAMQKQKSEPLAADERALQRLINALEKHGRNLRERLAALPSAVNVSEADVLQAQAPGMRDFYGPPYSLGTTSLPGEADEVLAALLETIGGKGRELAERIRNESEEALHRHAAKEIGEDEVWQPWFPTVDGRPPARHAALVVALWHDVVRRTLSKMPALARAIYTPVTELLGKPTIQLDASTGQRTLSSGSALIARAVSVDASAVRYLDRGLKLFDSIHAHRILFHLASEGHRRALEGVLDPRALRYSGGYGALAEACGIRGHRGAEQVRAIVEAMATLDVPLAPGHWAHLFSRDFAEAKGRRQAQLTIVLGTPLLPDYVNELRATVGEHGVAAHRAIDLIPLLPIPPVTGRTDQQGKQASLAMRVVSHLRDHAVELVTEGGALLTPSRFEELAGASRLSAAMAPRVLEHWQQAHQDGPAFLKRTGPDRYTLGDAHLAERLFLEEGGRRSLDGRVGGLKSNQKRTRAWVRPGGK